MSLIRWDSANELSSLQSEVNRVFSSFFDPSSTFSRDGKPGKWVPAIDLTEQGDHYLLHADLPGLSEQEVNVELEDDVLTISGERHNEQEKKRDGYYRLERVSGSFSRSLRLPEGVDPHGIQARFDKGVLEVKIPKPIQQQSQRVAIEVKSGKS